MKIKVKVLVKSAIMAVIAFLLMQVEMIVPIFPAFLKLDLSDLPAVIGGFSMGPFAGVLISLIKNLLHLFQTTTGGVGELANFLISISMIIPAAFIYSKNRCKAYAIIGLSVGISFMVITGTAVNYYLMLPFYSHFIPMDQIIEMGSITNSAIYNAETLVLYAIAPFNALKGSMIAIITTLLYKKISPLIQNF